MTRALDVPAVEDGTRSGRCSMSHHHDRPTALHRNGAGPRGSRRRRCLSAVAAALFTALSSYTVAAAAPPAAGALDPVPSTGCGSSAVSAGTTIESFGAAGRFGSYIRDVPATGAGTPMPVVFDIHGYLQPALMQRQWSGLGEYGLRHGFVTITPEVYSAAVPRWDFGLGSPDITYLSELLTHLEQTLCIDRRRIYMTGLSMGAFTTSSVACQLADRFAAIATVAGIQNFPWCSPSRPIPVTVFHGTADPILAYTGGLNPAGELLPATDGTPRTLGRQRDLTPYADNVPKPESIPAHTAAWAGHNGCRPDPTTEQITTDTTRTTYPCADDATVQLYTIDGGGHTWPGGDTTTVPVALTGTVTTTINANHIIWDFFRAHPLPHP